jgi:hypothetical protein
MLRKSVSTARDGSAVRALKKPAAKLARARADKKSAAPARAAHPWPGAGKRWAMPVVGLWGELLIGTLVTLLLTFAAARLAEPRTNLTLVWASEAFLLAWILRRGYRSVIGPVIGLALGMAAAGMHLDRWPTFVATAASALTAA